MNNIVNLAVSLGILAAQPAWAAESFTEADVGGIRTFLRDHFSNTNAGMVIGIVDESGSRVFHGGKLDNGTDQEVNGDTVFEIGSVTKTFTSLLALEMESRGEIRLSDPVSSYLPKSVKVPDRDGQEITLRHLADQTSALPFNADNLQGADWSERFNAYTAEDMYRFLGSYTLPNAPGAKFQYSNLGMSLLGHVMELKAGTNYESLVVNRICRPLGMDNTAITLTPELKARLAAGHDETGKRAPYYDLKVMAGAGALCSTANDLVKYIAANLGLTSTSLKAFMEEMQLIHHRGDAEFGKTAMPWYDQAVYNPPGSQLLGHGGGTIGFSAFVGFDLEKRCGVVVLSNQKALHSSTIGWAILQRGPLTRASGTEFVRELVGLGAAVELDKDLSMLRITKVYPNSGAAQAGLDAGMMVQSINDVPVRGKTLPECLALLRGNAGTMVRLEILKPDRTETNTVEVTRQKFLTSS